MRPKPIVSFFYTREDKEKEKILHPCLAIWMQKNVLLFFGPLLAKKGSKQIFEGKRIQNRIILKMTEDD